MSKRLKALDADHFWFDGVMIDIPSIHHDCRRVANLPNCDGRKSHSLGFNLQYLYHAASQFGTDGERFVTPKTVSSALIALNKLGVRTGWKEGLDGEDK